MSSGRSGLLKQLSGLKSGSAKVAPTNPETAKAISRIKQFEIPDTIHGDVSNGFCQSRPPSNPDTTLTPFVDAAPQDGTKVKEGILKLLGRYRHDVDEYYPPVIVSYATGTRYRDTPGNGPGMYYASKVIVSLKAEGIDAFSGLHGE